MGALLRGPLAGVTVLAAISLGAALPAGAGSRVPATCPIRSIIASHLGVKVSKVHYVKGPGSLDCFYETSAGIYQGKEVIPTEVRYASPISTSTFTLMKSNNVSHGVVLVNISHLGNAAYVAIGSTPWLYVHIGTLQLILIAPKASVGAIVGLGHSLVP